MLPADKAGFPKCLYLDQNKWIALSRAACGLDDGSHNYLLGAIKEAVALKRLVVPLSDIHILETLAPGNLDRRRRLATMMVDLSANYGIRPARVIQEAEISCAVASTLGVFLPYEIRRHVVVKGITEALGGALEISSDPAKVRKVHAHLISHEHSIDLLTNEEIRVSLNTLRQRETADALEQSKRSAQAVEHLSKDELLRMDVWNIMHQPRVLDRIQKTVRLLRISAARMNSHLASFDHHLRFIRRIPSLNVELTLWQQRFKNRDRKTDRNDWKDIGFLSVAVPYANIVVTEKYWSHVCGGTGLTRKYQTVVTASLEDLPRLLEEQGCIGTRVLV